MHLRTLVLAALLATLPAVACAGTAPQYHLQPITIEGASDVFVAAINNAGQAVGYYVDADYSNQAFLFDGTQVVTLPLPADRTEAFATGINDQGQIVGYATAISDDGTQTTALLWDAAAPALYTVIGDDPSYQLNPADINNNGVVVGLASQDGAFRAFTWSQAGGLVDDGVPTHGADTQAYWSAINDAGAIVGGWNPIFANSHATSGQLGTPGFVPVAAGVDDVASMAHDIGEDGTVVGEMDLAHNGKSVPVIFSNGVASAVPGALLGLANGSALGINAAGTIVGRAQDFTTFSFKAFVSIEGESYDVLQNSDAAADYPYLLSAVSINDSGAIVGLGRVGDFNVGSYIATPVGGDAIFTDGFDGH